MKCPFCQSDKLVITNEDTHEDCCVTLPVVTHCCDECGGSFEVVQEPQGILLKDALEKREDEKAEEFFNKMQDYNRRL